jgi:hypothetical protein
MSDNFREQTASAGRSSTDAKPNTRQRKNFPQTNYPETQERVFQSDLEFWKIQYDFFKHLMTLAIALIAGFGAMLGGVFEDQVVLESLGSFAWSVPAFCFILLIISATSSGIAARESANVIQELGQIQSFDEPDFQSSIKSVAKEAKTAGVSLALALMAFMLFATAFFWIRYDPQAALYLSWAVYVILLGGGALLPFVLSSRKRTRQEENKGKDHFTK